MTRSAQPGEVGHDPATAPAPNLCPTDLSPLPPVAAATRDEVARAVHLARRAQDAWRATPLDERVRRLREAAKSMLARRHEAIELVRAEIGKVDAEAIFNETLGPLDTVNRPPTTSAHPSACCCCSSSWCTSTARPSTRGSAAR